MLTIITDALVSLFYPQSCGICGQNVENSADGVACRDCWTKTKTFSGRDILCGKCGLFLKESDHPIETFCQHCGDHSYDSARAAGPYENALSAAVIHLKRSPKIAGTTQNLLIDSIRRRPLENIDIVVPVPLSKNRFLERGFNQAAVLARFAAKELKIPIDEHTLVRRIHTPMHRAAMDRKARELTVKNAFEVTRPKLVNGKRILLVDDVLTSGSTVSHCAKVLKKNGAARVDVLTLARAVL